jgi:hypothetical protein
MSFFMVFDNVHGTPSIPEDRDDLRWELVFHTSGLSIFTDAESRYHVAKDDPEHALLSAYPLLGADRNKLQEQPLRCHNEQELFELADFQFPFPYALAVVNKKQKTAVVKTDPFGIAKIYLHDDGTKLMVSNRLGPIVQLSRRPMTLNTEALCIFGTIGWFLHESTPINEISQLPPDTTLRLSAEITRPKIISCKSRYYTQLFDLIKSLERESLESLAIGSMVNMVRRLSEESDRPLRASLSGGRDSRFMAALILASKVKADFQTTNYFSEETQVVRELLMGSDPEQISLEIREPQSRTSIEKAEGLIKSLISHTDGMLPDLKAIGRSTLPAAWSGTYQLSGLGGELTHGFYYPSDIATADIKRVSKRIERKEILIAETSERVRNNVRGGIREASDQWKAHCRIGGLRMDDLKFADFFYLAQRLRRKSRLGVRSGIIAPMVNLHFMALTFHLNGEEARQASIQKKFVKAFDPRWGEIGYVGLSERGHTERLTKQEDPLLLLDLCEDSSLVREMWGPRWRQCIMELSSTQPFRASWMINAVIAVNGIVAHFDALRGQERRRPRGAWRLGVNWLRGRGPRVLE